MEEQSERSAIIGRLPDPVLDPRDTALLVVDLQYLDAHPEGFHARRAKAHGVFHTMDYFFRRLDQAVIPNVRQLLEAFRRSGMRIVFVRIASRMADGSDLSWRYKQFGVDCPENSWDAQILEELAPLPGELVVSKTTSSAFNSTTLELMLKNMGIRKLVVVGVATNSCVESTVRDAADLGFHVVLVEDGCAAKQPEDDPDTMRRMHRSFAVVRGTSEVLQEIASLSAVR